MSACRWCTHLLCSLPNRPTLSNRDSLAACCIQTTIKEIAPASDGAVEAGQARVLLALWP